MDNRKTEKYLEIAFIAVFFLIITIPVIFWGNQKERSIKLEKRFLNEFYLPADMSAITSDYTKDVESFITDHLGFRADFVTFTNQLRYKIFGADAIPSSERVIEGKDGWLFYNPQGISGDPIGDYLGETTFSNEDINNIINQLLSIQSVCDSVGSKFCLVICPNKECIYGDLYLPDYYSQERAEETRTDKLVDRIKDTTNIDCVYSKEELMSQRDDYLLYYKHDTHWNKLGAYITYREWYSHVFGKELPELESCRLTPDESEYCDLANNMGIIMEPDQYYSVDLGREYTVNTEITDSDLQKYSEYTSSNHNGLTSVIFRDSYSNALLPYMLLDYEKSYVFSKRIDQNDLEFIRETKPDIVVFEIVERLIGLLQEE